MEIIAHGKTYQVYTCPECGSVVKDKWREKR